MTEGSGGRIGVGMVGHAFMGAVHSHAWRTAHRFFDLPVTPELAVLGGRDLARTKAAAAKFGFASVQTDWRELVNSPDVQIVDICTPGDSHCEIAVAALEAGKHVLCEKPLANTVEEAEAMTAAAEAAKERGVRSMVAFNYRRVPAIAYARKLIEAGRLGEIRHVRALYLQDWLSDENAPMTWRLRKESAGSGALGDLGAHIVDATQYLVGELLTGVSALTNTFVAKRPDESGEKIDDVTVDDAAVFFGRFASGALATYEATRFALGRKNGMSVEINGSLGSLRFEFESMNELYFFDGANADDEGGFRRILVTEPTHPYVGAWWPPGHLLGYEHTFTHEVVDFVRAIHTGIDPAPSFADGLQVQRVLGAVERSAENGSAWTEVQ
ncbi:Gfo/Idh/MocA family protein [Actinophytocola sp. NPDC049390]|uniref:Gfo/Idh/MocA family protein n=1 Tax=Actinophytocola sp. NPDC049390 TaxID=3363894 RepID=UPI00379CF5C1